MHDQSCFVAVETKTSISTKVFQQICSSSIGSALSVIDRSRRHRDVRMSSLDRVFRGHCGRSGVAYNDQQDRPTCQTSVGQCRSCCYPFVCGSACFLVLLSASACSHQAAGEKHGKTIHDQFTNKYYNKQHVKFSSRFFIIPSVNRRNKTCIPHYLGEIRTPCHLFKLP